MKYIALILIASILLFPLYWMFTGSLQPIMGIIAMPPRFIPLVANFENYKILILNHPIVRWICNTLIIWAATVVLSVAITAMAGFAFSIYDFRFKKVIYWIFIASLMIPRQVMIIPLFVLSRGIGIVNTRLGAILPLLFWPFGILIFKTYCDGISKDIIDSGRIDGAGELRIIKDIIIPISKPAMGVLVLFKSLEVLGDFIWQMLVLQKESIQTLLIGIIFATERRGSDSVINLNPIGIQLAAGVILFIPLLIIFIFTSKYFVKDIKLGGIKE